MYSISDSSSEPPRFKRTRSPSDSGLDWLILRTVAGEAPAAWAELKVDCFHSGDVQPLWHRAIVVNNISARLEARLLDL